MATLPIVLTHIEALLRKFELEREMRAFQQPSTDDLAKFLKSWAQKHHLVRIINSDSDINNGHPGAVPDEAAAQNVGQCVSRNRMFQASCGHFILFLDCDIVPIPHSIGYMLEYLQCRPGVGGVHYEVKTETVRLIDAGVGFADGVFLSGSVTTEGPGVYFKHPPKDDPIGPGRVSWLGKGHVKA